MVIKYIDWFNQNIPYSLACSFAMVCLGISLYYFVKYVFERINGTAQAIVRQIKKPTTIICFNDNIYQCIIEPFLVTVIGDTLEECVKNAIDAVRSFIDEFSSSVYVKDVSDNGAASSEMACRMAKMSDDMLKKELMLDDANIARALELGIEADEIASDAFAAYRKGNISRIYNYRKMIRFQKKHNIRRWNKPALVTPNSSDSNAKKIMAPYVAFRMGQVIYDSFKGDNWKLRAMETFFISEEDSQVLSSNKKD